MQTREVNGQKQVFDEHLTAWRPWAPLDDMGQRLQLQQPQQRLTVENYGGEGKVRCPKCNSTVQLLTSFTGWETESIDPVSGERIRVEDSERDDVHDETYQCTRACGWQAGFEWLEEMLYADQEEEAEEIFQEAPAFSQPQLFTWELDPGGILIKSNPF